MPKKKPGQNDLDFFKKCFASEKKDLYQKNPNLNWLFPVLLACLLLFLTVYFSKVR